MEIGESQAWSVKKKTLDIMIEINLSKPFDKVISDDVFDSTYYPLWDNIDAIVSYLTSPLAEFSSLNLENNLEWN